MVLLNARIQFFEITDQEWFPKYLRERIQSCLALFWTIKVPLVQEMSPAQLVARTICRVLDDPRKYRYVDFCAGAGGPTPVIEQELNLQLASHLTEKLHGSFTGNTTRDSSPVQFVLTDLHPHIPEWTRISGRTKNITFIPKSVDATSAPSSLKSNNNQKIFRLFNLSFHHFDDKLGSEILRNCLETSDGFGIFELQERTFSSLLVMVLLGLELIFISPFYFWKFPGHLFFTNVIPILPLVVFLDGCISSLRTRTTGEVLDLVNKCGASSNDWTVISGQEQHTWPLGYLSWIIAIKKSSNDN